MRFLMECCVLNTKLKTELYFFSLLNICAGRTDFMESLENVSYFKVEFRGGPEMSLKILDSQRLAEYLLYSGHFIK